MIGMARPDTMWLIIVNILLGIGIITCMVLIAINLMKEMRHHRRERKEVAQVPDDYLEGLKALGVTLPDGGERIDEMDEETER